ncbi:MAG: PTS sugar transporter subunit IIB [Gemmatimonadetes bacterium]|nr:PTS sugar transporter subunit IIB [Gemmatimonadota bacterium]
MPVDVFRIDDRLIHGQVVVGWGQPLDIAFVVLVDDAVADSDWEQDLYRMGVPPGMTVSFLSVEGAIAALPALQADARHGLVLTGDIATMQRLAAGAPAVRAVNLGGVHHAPGRTQRLRYVFLSSAEEAALRDMAASGVTITAQDVPASRPVPLEQVLAGTDLS